MNYEGMSRDDLLEVLRGLMQTREAVANLTRAEQRSPRPPWSSPRLLPV